MSARQISFELLEKRWEPETAELSACGIYDFEMKNKAIAAFSEWSNI